MLTDLLRNYRKGQWQLRILQVITSNVRSGWRNSANLWHNYIRQNSVWNNFVITVFRSTWRNKYTYTKMWLYKNSWSWIGPSTYSELLYMDEDHNTFSTTIIYLHNSADQDRGTSTRVFKIVLHTYFVFIDLFFTRHLRRMRSKEVGNSDVKSHEEL